MQQAIVTRSAKSRTQIDVYIIYTIKSLSESGIKTYLHMNKLKWDSLVFTFGTYQLVEINIFLNTPSQTLGLDTNLLINTLFNILFQSNKTS